MSLLFDPTHPDPLVHGPNPTQPTEKYKIATRPDPLLQFKMGFVFIENLSS